ncbi:MAG: hypothetical protein Q8M03_08440 [Legionella sp.]|nr:hypothetical protein [Legionella sp.]
MVVPVLVSVLVFMPLVVGQVQTLPAVSVHVCAVVSVVPVVASPLVVVFMELLLVSVVGVPVFTEAVGTQVHTVPVESVHVFGLVVVVVVIISVLACTVEKRNVAAAMQKIRFIIVSWLRGIYSIRCGIAILMIIASEYKLCYF